MNSQLFRCLRVALMGVASATTLGVANADASARYSFTGQDYTYIYPAAGCLTTNMHLSMKIVLATKLAPNLSNQSVTAISWIVKDGLHKFKDTQAKAIVPLQAQFSTDGNGHITAWSVNAYYYTKNGIDLLYTTHSTTGGDYSDDDKCVPSTVGSNFVPGTWKPN